MEQREQFILSPATEEQIIRYLFDEMSADERSNLEERLVREPSFFELISAVEDDLIMQYVTGSLDRRLAPRFAEIYLHSPAKRARIASAQALRQAVLDTSGQQKISRPTLLILAKGSRFRLSMAAAAACIALIAVLFSVWNKTRPHGVPAAEGASLLSFSLEPGLQRGSAGIQISIPAGVQEVKFKLALPRSTSEGTYQVILETPEHPGLWTGTALRDGPAVVTTVPHHQLTAGDYTLTLRAASADANSDIIEIYYLRVKK